MAAIAEISNLQEIQENILNNAKTIDRTYLADGVYMQGFDQFKDLMEKVEKKITSSIFETAGKLDLRNL